MKITITPTLLFLSLNVIAQIPLSNPFKASKEPTSKVISYSFQKMLEKVNDTLYLEKVFQADTKELNTLRSYKSINPAVLNGYFCEKWDDGEIFIEGNFKNNTKVGRWKEYDKEGSYIDGKKSGEWKNYFPNGKLLSIENYLNDKLNGDQKIFNINGDLISNNTYEDGKLLKEEIIIKTTVNEMPFLIECVQLDDEKSKQECSVQKLLEFIFKNSKYPKSARNRNIHGQVIVHFIVSKNGYIDNYEVRRSLSNDIKAEIESLYDKFPKWHPGMQNGTPVDVRYSLPIKYKLN
ncbi:MAG TPA: TonB family protein [Saprospiraceae bacterium]|nr:TonB family protein [Saprospiraceae bacterium]